MAVSARGIFSVTIRMIAMIMMANVAIMVFITVLPYLFQSAAGWQRIPPAAMDVSAHIMTQMRENEK